MQPKTGFMILAIRTKAIATGVIDKFCRFALITAVNGAFGKSCAADPDTVKCPELIIIKMAAIKEMPVLLNQRSQMDQKSLLKF